MSRPKEVLQKLQRLTDGSDPLLSGKQATKIRRQAADLERAYLHLDDIVVVALAGGTGVGKSTLINALAGTTIAAPGVKRPTSDHVAVYLHKQVDFAPRVSPDTIPFKEHKHTSDQLRKVIILDLPDCDSISTMHKRITNEVLPHTDLLLLVTDPAKYGDRIFYELAETTRHAQENKFIVLNKVDTLEVSYGEKKETVLNELLSDFSGKLGTLWPSEAPPRILPISASEAFEAKTGHRKPDALFRALEQVLFDLKDKKLREKIKQRNLDTEFGSLRETVLDAVEHSSFIGKTALLDRRIENAHNEMTAYARGLVEASFTEQAHTDFRKYFVGRVTRSWSFPAKVTARISKLTAGGPAPESGLLAKRLASFNAKLERTERDLYKTYTSQWKSAPVEEAEKPDVHWDLSQKAEEFTVGRKRKRFFLTVVAGVVLFFFFAARPAAVEFLEDMQTDAPFRESAKQFFIASLKGILVSFHPFYLLSWLAGLIILYASSVLIVLLRIRLQADHALSELKASLTAELEDMVERHLAPYRTADKEIREKAAQLTSLFR